MKQKYMWTSFLSCIALVGLWFSIDSSYQIYRWATQTKTAKPISIEWSVEKQANGRFSPFAHYTFSHNEKNIQGSTLFASERYKNAQTAQYFADAHAKKKWTVRYSSFQVQNSTIDQFFPLKSSIYTAIVWCILLYFILIRRYVRRLCQ